MWSSIAGLLERIVSWLGSSVGSVVTALIRHGTRAHRVGEPARRTRSARPQTINA